MPSWRLAGSLAALAATLGAAAALAAWGAPGVGATGSFDLEVLGPQGALLSERVEAADATALSLLQVACAARGIEIELERYPGMGAYVRAIGGHRAEGASGWVYEVQRGGVWVNGDRSAEDFPLQKGDALRWSWTRR